MRGVSVVAGRLGTATILGLAVGGRWSRFRPKRFNFAQTALRVQSSRVAICPALRPAQSFFSRITFVSFHIVGLQHEEQCGQ